LSQSGHFPATNYARFKERISWQSVVGCERGDAGTSCRSRSLIAKLQLEGEILTDPYGENLK